MTPKTPPGVSCGPRSTDLSDPHALAGLDQAVEVIVATVRSGGRIMVHGDYDVDGQCSSALLTRVLREAGADVLPFVPHRLRDGYDFGPAGLEAAQAAGAALVITCDCGITANDTVLAANAAGIGVVVTDHHLPGAELPPALAVIDPQRSDDSSGAGFLCGTGIAFKLVQALVPALGLPANLPFHLLDLVALATVADVVPLQGENRILVKHGLKLLANSRWPGVRALVEATGLAGKEIRARHVGFVLGPRLNAAGRVGDASDGLRLLLSDDPAESTALAQKLEVLNIERQALDQRMLDEALEQVEQTADLDRDAGFVLVGDGWHPGVVGIVASRVVERYGRPTFLIAFDGDIGKGSGRSTSRFNLHSALLSCGDLLERYGGHHMAAGLTIRRGQSGRLPRALRRLRPSGTRSGRPRSRAAGGPGAEPPRGHPRAGAAVPASRAYWPGQLEPGVRGPRGSLPQSQRGGQRPSQGRAGRRHGTALGHRIPMGRPGALAGRRIGGRGVPHRVRRVERLQQPPGAALRAVAPRRLILCYPHGPAEQNQCFGGAFPVTFFSGRVQDRRAVSSAGGGSWCRRTVGCVPPPIGCVRPG